MHADATTPWFAGLGQRGDTPAPALPNDGDQDPDFNRPSIHRTVDAATAPSVVPPNAVVSPFTSWRGAGSAAASTEEDTAADETTTEEEPMPQPTETNPVRKPRAAKTQSPQYQICAVLVQHGPQTREELLAQTAAQGRTFQNGLHNAKHLGRIEFLKRAGKFRATKAGEVYVAGGMPAETPAAKPARRKAEAAPKPQAKPARVKPQRAGRRVTAMANAEFVEPAQHLAERAYDPAVERAFRCAVFSDGSFHLAKAGQAIDLTPTEHADMLRYLEGMAEQTA